MVSSIIISTMNSEYHSEGTICQNSKQSRSQPNLMETTSQMNTVISVCAIKYFLPSYAMIFIPKVALWGYHAGCRMGNSRMLPWFTESRYPSCMQGWELCRLCAFVQRRQRPHDRRWKDCSLTAGCEHTEPYRLRLLIDLIWRSVVKIRLRWSSRRIFPKIRPSPLTRPLPSLAEMEQSRQYMALVSALISNL